MTNAVYKAGTTEPVSGALVTIANLPALDAAATSAQGMVDFLSHGFPDVLEVRIEHEELGVALYDDLSLPPGVDEGFLLKVPKSGN